MSSCQCVGLLRLFVGPVLGILMGTEMPVTYTAFGELLFFSTQVYLPVPVLIFQSYSLKTDNASQIHESSGARPAMHRETMFFIVFPEKKKNAHLWSL